jgi:hypothetical protein
VEAGNGMLHALSSVTGSDEPEGREMPRDTTAIGSRGRTSRMAQPPSTEARPDPGSSLGGKCRAGQRALD